jgi:hypothetical protein
MILKKKIFGGNNIEYKIDIQNKEILINIIKDSKKLDIKYAKNKLILQKPIEVLQLKKLKITFDKLKKIQREPELVAQAIEELKSSDPDLTIETNDVEQFITAIDNKIKDLQNKISSLDSLDKIFKDHDIIKFIDQVNEAITLNTNLKILETINNIFNNDTDVELGNEKKVNFNLKSNNDNLLTILFDNNYADNNKYIKEMLEQIFMIEIRYILHKIKQTTAQETSTPVEWNNIFSNANDILKENNAILFGGKQYDKYYIKYLKYKTKYINKKNMLQGSGITQTDIEKETQSIFNKYQIQYDTLESDNEKMKSKDFLILLTSFKNLIENLKEKIGNEQNKDEIIQEQLGLSFNIIKVQLKLFLEQYLKTTSIDGNIEKEILTKFNEIFNNLNQMLE